jgi:hypothetical protein
MATKSKLLNFKVTYKGIFIALLVVTALAFLVARMPVATKIGEMTGNDPNRIHGLGEKVYTVGMIALLVMLALAVVGSPLVMFLLLMVAASLVYHLIQKFK